MKQWWLSLVMVYCATSVLYAQAGTSFRSQPVGRSNPAENTIDKNDYRNIKVVEVLKGDTVRLENGELLRFIGVNPPEYQKTSKRYGDSKITGIPEEVLEVMGNEVIQFTRGLVENKYICVEFDVQQRDQYGILLGYVFLPDQDLFVNAEIIKHGYTSGVVAAPNNRYQALFSKFYAEIKQRSEGIWRQWQRE